MKSDKVILVAGGDLRQQYAAQRLRQKTGAAVWTVGLPVQPNLHFAETPAEVPAYDVLVLPVLAGSSGETVPAPFGTSPLSLSELAAQGKPAALVAGGGCSGGGHWFEAAGMTVTDYLRREELCLANAVPTAEGAIRIAMEETARTLHGASALVVGYGRIGMALAPRLRALGMQTEICARRCETRALAQMQGFSAVPVSALAQRAAAADVIFNTVPVLLLSETVLKALPPETLVIDLASRPGGTDFDAAKIRVLEGVGNDRHPETALFRVADREAHAVDRHRTFLDRAESGALRLVLEGEVPASVGILLGRADGRLIDMPLHDVAVEQRIGLHRAFEVHQVALPEQAEVAAVERLLHGRHRVGILRKVYDGQAHAVVGDALVDFQIPAEVCPKRKVLVLTVGTDRDHLAHALHDA